MCWSGSVHSTKDVSRLILRVFFGLSLIFVGITHYKTIGDFAAFVGDGLGPLAPVGVAWGYILPGLMILGGLIFVIGKFPVVGVWAAGIALGSIPAGILLKSVVADMPLGDTMPGALNAFTWLIVYMFAVKAFCGCGMKKKCCEPGKDCGCGPGKDCTCAKGEACQGCCK